MEVLLLGGTGTLSTDIMLLSLQKGHSVYILNRGNSNQNVPQHVKILKADIKNSDSVISAIESLHFDVVVDFLSRTSNDLEHTYIIFKDICKQYIFISTACVYKREEDQIIAENSEMPNINWSYNIEKFECEQKLKELASKHIYTIVRPYITYDRKRIPYGITPADYQQGWTIIGRFLAHKPMFIWNDGNNTCTLTSAKDFAEGVVGLFMNPKAKNESFHITSNEVLTWNEVLHTLKDVLNSKSEIIHIPVKEIIKDFPEYKGMLLGDRTLNAHFSNKKIREAVPSFNPTPKLKDEITCIIQNYRDNRYFKGIDYVWDAKVDRLISRYYPNNTKFVDYLQMHSRRDYTIYLLHRYLCKDKISQLARNIHKLLIK